MFETCLDKVLSLGPGSDRPHGKNPVLMSSLSSLCPFVASAPGYPRVLHHSQPAHSWCFCVLVLLVWLRGCYRRAPRRPCDGRVHPRLSPKYETWLLAGEQTGSRLVGLNVNATTCKAKSRQSKEKKIPKRKKMIQQARR